MVDRWEHWESGWREGGGMFAASWWVYMWEGEWVVAHQAKAWILPKNWMLICYG